MVEEYSGYKHEEPISTAIQRYGDTPGGTMTVGSTITNGPYQCPPQSLQLSLRFLEECFKISAEYNHIIPNGRLPGGTNTLKMIQRLLWHNTCGVHGSIAVSDSATSRNVTVIITQSNNVDVSVLQEVDVLLETTTNIYVYTTTLPF